MLDRVDGPASRTFPFAGIVARPYAQNSITAEWADIMPIYVSLEDITLTQEKVTIRGMFGQTYSHDRFPRIVGVTDALYVEDGHHRIVDAAIRGQRDVLARVWFI